jgi:hypothetical protein
MWADKCPCLQASLRMIVGRYRYIDRLESQTGLKANRGMIVRWAVALFLETRAADPSAPSL